MLLVLTRPCQTRWRVANLPQLVMLGYKGHLVPLTLRVVRAMQQETLLEELRRRERLLKQTSDPTAESAPEEKEQDTAFKSFLAQQYSTSGLALI